MMHSLGEISCLEGMNKKEQYISWLYGCVVCDKLQGGHKL
jgi:hypothetical protein